MALTATAGSDSKRTIIVVIVALLHVGMYYVIESGLSQHLISMLAPPVQTKIIEEQIKQEDLPPPPPPDIAEPPPFIPPPEVTIQIQTASTAIQVVTNERPPAVVPPVVAPPAPTIAPSPAKRDPKKSKDPNDYYPAASNRADETGQVQVRCLAGLDGKCTQASVTKSSGYARLDEAAVKYATEGLRVLPGTENGVPVAKWFDFLVTFKQQR